MSRREEDEGLVGVMKWEEGDDPTVRGRRTLTLII